MVLDAVNAVSLFGKYFQPVNGVNPVSGGAEAGETKGVNPFTPVARSGGDSNGELISNYGSGGASALAYKGISNDPNQTVGARLDTKRLGLYGFGE